MSLTIWEYNGKEYELDISDADTAERYEDAFGKMGIEEKQLPKTGKPSEQIRAYSQLFVRLFDLLFYKGAGREILPKDSIRAANEAYRSFLDFVAEQKNESDRFMAETRAKYSPNRTQRRAAMKKQ